MITKYRYPKRVPSGAKLTCKTAWCERYELNGRVYNKIFDLDGNFAYIESFRVKPTCAQTL